MRDDVYLRGSVATWYSRNHWRRGPPPTAPEPIRDWPPDDTLPERPENRDASDPDFQIGPPVVQQITMEPYLDSSNSLFFIWPLVVPAGGRVVVASDGRLMRCRMTSAVSPAATTTSAKSAPADWSTASGPAIPASREIGEVGRPYLQMPGDPWPLPRLKALAARWLRESGL